MKRALVLLLILIPSIAFAKYCPTCLRTYQAQTPRGQTRVIYKWISRVGSGALPLDLPSVKQLFSEDAVITVNGKRMATGQQAIYDLFHTELLSKKLIESQMKQILTEGKNSSLKYEFITEKNGAKYRNLAITLFHFENHKITDWWDLRYTTQFNG